MAHEGEVDIGKINDLPSDAVVKPAQAALRRLAEIDEEVFADLEAAGFEEEVVRRHMRNLLPKVYQRELERILSPNPALLSFVKWAQSEEEDSMSAQLGLAELEDTNQTPGLAEGLTMAALAIGCALYGETFNPLVDVGEIVSEIIYEQTQDADVTRTKS